MVRRLCYHCKKGYLADNPARVYCSRTCKERAKEKRKRMTRNSDWKVVKAREKCEICGYREEPEILQVHHLDHNRKNNVLKNLVKVCPNCHVKLHCGIISYKRRETKVLSET